MKNLISIVGPTGIGKTALAVSLGRKLNGNLLNADSRQVYKGLDIISGKDISKNSTFHPLFLSSISSSYAIGYHVINSVPIFLLDIVSPSYSFNVSDYVTVALPVIHYIEELLCLPILVGGSGYYIKALLDGIETIHIKPDLDLRKNLEKKKVKELQLHLEKLSKKRYQDMNQSDRNNPRRLIRAIEVLTSKENSDTSAVKLKDYKVFQIGLTAPRETIKNRIDDRVNSRIHHGAFEEAEKLFKDYRNLSSQAKTGNGYKQLFEYYLGKITREEAIESWKGSEYQNAKKQLTWFKKDARIHWFDITEKNTEKSIFSLTNSFLFSVA